MESSIENQQDLLTSTHEELVSLNDEVRRRTSGVGIVGILGTRTILTLEEKQKQSETDSRGLRNKPVIHNDPSNKFPSNESNQYTYRAEGNIESSLLIYIL